MTSIFAILMQQRLYWLGHITQMNVGRLFGKLTSGTRFTGCPTLRYKDFCKQELRSGGYNPFHLEAAALDRSSWRTTTRAMEKERRDNRWERSISKSSNSSNQFKPRLRDRCKHSLVADAVSVSTCTATTYAAAP